MVEITELLHRAHLGDNDALERLAPLVYAELKKLAAAHLRSESSSNTFNTTALVHEAYLRLLKGQQPAYENRAHFFGIASRLMRQVLVDAARARAAGKRGGGGAHVELSLAAAPASSDPGAAPNTLTVLMIDAALHRLAASDPQGAELIEMRFFGGMTAEESAGLLQLPVEQVRRQLRLAQASLMRELSR